MLKPIFCFLFQGSESNMVVYVVGSAWNQTWQHVYTAVTRGRTKVILLTQPQHLSKAIDTKPWRRNTTLQQRLAESLNPGAYEFPECIELEHSEDAQDSMFSEWDEDEVTAMLDDEDLISQASTGTSKQEPDAELFASNDDFADVAEPAPDHSHRRLTNQNSQLRNIIAGPMQSPKSSRRQLFNQNETRSQLTNPNESMSLPGLDELLEFEDEIQITNQNKAVNVLSNENKVVHMSTNQNQEAQSANQIEESEAQTDDFDEWDLNMTQAVFKSMDTTTASHDNSLLMSPRSTRFKPYDVEISPMRRRLQNVNLLRDQYQAGDGEKK